MQRKYGTRKNTWDVSNYVPSTHGNKDFFLYFSIPTYLHQYFEITISDVYRKIGWGIYIEISNTYLHIYHYIRLIYVENLVQSTRRLRVSTNRPTIIRPSISYNFSFSVNFFSFHLFILIISYFVYTYVLF